jgi:uncharacterized protein (DUF58 family)
MRHQRVTFRLTPNAVAFAFVLVAIWYAASSQQNAAAYLLLFGLIGVASVSVRYSFTNVKHLTVRADAITPVFAGEDAAVPLELANVARQNRYGIRIGLDNPSSNVEPAGAVAPGQAIRATVRFPTQNRGQHQLDTVRLESTFPLGLLRISRELPVKQRYLVYPRPKGNPQLPATDGEDGSRNKPPKTRPGDDFSGARPYIPGESQRHIDWKAVARGQAVLTKQFTTEEETGLLYLDFEQTGAGTTEDRLSQLTLWAIEAERLRRPYGLRLRSVNIVPSLGEMHFHRCLRALALFR